MTATYDIETSCPVLAWRLLLLILWSEDSSESSEHSRPSTQPDNFAFLSNQPVCLTNAFQCENLLPRKRLRPPTHPAIIVQACNLVYLMIIANAMTATYWIEFALLCSGVAFASALSFTEDGSIPSECSRFSTQPGNYRFVLNIQHYVVLFIVVPFLVVLIIY
jgi:hypothetical protein